MASNLKTMRIISGNLKGKNVEFLKSSTTRPLKDSVKENIFNVLAHSNLLNINLKSSNILDLYSGIGSFGLECISRGTKKVTFVEKNKAVIEILKKNLESLKIIDNAFIVNDLILNFLKKEHSKKYDLVFLDPPFTDTNFTTELKLIRERKICNKRHIIIIHREKKSHDDLKDIFNTQIIRQYGRSKIIFGHLLY